MQLDDNMTPQQYKAAFIANLQAARTEVKKWPEWKRRAIIQLRDTQELSNRSLESDRQRKCNEGTAKE